MTQREHTPQIVTVLCHAANNAAAWLRAIRNDAAFAQAYRAFELDQMSNSARENLVLEFTRVFNVEVQ